MVCRHLWERLKLAFPRKSKLPLAEWRLSCHHHVNDPSCSCHASRSVCHCLDVLTEVLFAKKYIDWKHRPLVNLGWSPTTSSCWPYWPQLLSFVSKCRLWKACLTTVWHHFQAKTCSKKSSARLFWVYWSKRMFWWFFPRVLGKV